jgi:hypothetical protein
VKIRGNKKINSFIHRMMNALVSNKWGKVAKGKQLACINDVRMWCAARWLQLNADETELIWFGSHTELKKLSTAVRTLIVDGTPLQPSEVVRYLGVLFDSEMTMKPLISKLTSVCFS